MPAENDGECLYSERNNTVALSSKFSIKKIALVAGIIATILVTFLSFSPYAHASTIPDTSRNRPDFNSYRTPMAAADRPATVPAGWTCRWKGQAGSDYMCIDPSSDRWLLDECSSGGGADNAGLNIICDRWDGQGAKSVQRTVYEEALQLGMGSDVHTETPQLDPETGQVNAVSEATVSNGGGGCGILNLGDCLGTAILFITEVIVAMLAGILGFISLIFNKVVIEFVIEMGKYITSPSAHAVRESWILIRDLSNIGIIGGLIAIGIGTILGIEKYSIQKTLARLLIAALLVNFSYFFAGAIIDVSNFTSREIYNNLVRDPSCTDAALHDADGSCGPAGRFLNTTSLDAWLASEQFRNNIIATGGNTADTVSSSLGAGTSPDAQTGENISFTQGIVYNIMRMIFICITGFVFLSAISLLAARFVALIFLIVTSPIGIAGGAIPLLDRYAKEWWDALWSQTMFAPVYFLLVGIAMSMLDAFKGSLLTANSPTPDVVGVIIMFVVAIGFMWAALSSAKEISAQAKRFGSLYKAAGAAFDWMPNLYKTAGGVVLRDTLGRAAFSAYEGYKKFSAANEFTSPDKFKNIPIVGGVMNAGTGALDRTIRNALHKTADREFIKGVKGFEATRKAIQADQALMANVKREEEQEKKYHEAGHVADHKEHARDKEFEEGSERRRVKDEKTGKERWESDKEFWARQALRDQRIKKADGTWETEKEAADRLGITLKDVLNESRRRDEKTGEWETDEQVAEKLGLKSAEHLLKTDANGKFTAKTAEELGREFGNKARVFKADQQMMERLGVKHAEDFLVQDPNTGQMRAMTFDELGAKFGDKVVAGDENKMGFESDAEYKARMQIGLGRKRTIGDDGEYSEEGEYNYLERLDKMKDLEGTDGVSFRDARAEAEGIFSTFTHDFLKRKYLEDPKSIVGLMRWAPYDKVKQVNDDQGIARTFKDKIAQQRWGKYAKMVYDIQKDVNDGKIVEFGDEYGRRMLIPYQYMQNNMKTPGEYEDFLRSTGVMAGPDGKPLTGDGKIGEAGKPLKFEDIRKMRAMQHAYSTTKFVDLSEQAIFGPTENRNRSTDKRKTFTNARDEHHDIQIAKGLESDEYAVPRVGGTTEMDGAYRARVRRREEMAALEKVISYAQKNPDEAIPSEVQAAEERLQYLQTLSKEKNAMENDILTVARLSGRVEPDGSVSKENREAIFRETKAALHKDFEGKSESEVTEMMRERRKNGTSNALVEIMNRENILEGGYDPTDPTGVPGFYKGKNSVKELRVLGKREAVTPLTIYGLDEANFKAIYEGSGFDKVEKDRFWENMLIYGNKGVLKNMLRNPNMKTYVSMPEPGTPLFNKIAEERARVYGKDDVELLENLADPLFNKT